MKKITFVFPVSNSAKWQGQLHVTAKANAQEAEIDKVEFEDKQGIMVDISELVFEWCNGLYDSLCDAARNDAENMDRIDEDDLMYSRMES